MRQLYTGIVDTLFGPVCQINLALSLFSRKLLVEDNSLRFATRTYRISDPHENTPQSYE